MSCLTIQDDINKWIFWLKEGITATVISSTLSSFTGYAVNYLLDKNVLDKGWLNINI